MRHTAFSSARTKVSLLTLVVVALFVWNPICISNALVAPPKKQQNRQCGHEFVNGQLYAMDSNADEKEAVEYRSISDYMGGHHAGKFDFDQRISGVTALNYEKSVIFDDSSACSQNGRWLAPLEDNDNDVPKWARRPVDLQAESSTPMILGIRDGRASVSIQNEEMSWEPFYATIESSSERMEHVELKVSPPTGNLAPRGGSDPYTDTVTLVVVSLPPKTTMPFPCFLVVRTEQDFWSWRIVME